jgi:hypothetical protein
MARASVLKIMAVLAMSGLSLPSLAQDQDFDAELVVCHFGGDLMTGAVLKGDAAIDDATETLADLPTIEDDGR